MSSCDSIFAAWLRKQSSGELQSIESLLSEHPEHAPELRELHGQWMRLETLRGRFGLSVSRPEGERSQGSPDRQLRVEESADATEHLISRLSQRGPGSTRYRREGELARGGMGRVLRVWDEDLRRRLAMKVLLEADASPEAKGDSRTQQLLARLLEEAQVTAQLDHPGVVPIHELGLGPDGEVYFTMKLVKGRTLAAVFEELAAGEGDWTQTRVLGLLVKVCDAMRYAHAKGVIHRDLKPANVMVGMFGEVYVMDWGLAKVLGRDDARDVRVRAESAPLSEVRSDRQDRAGDTPDSPLYTMDGDVVGTPAYMSPEQAMGRVSEMGPSSDVYALGAMLHHLLAGHAPYVQPGTQPHNYAVWQRVKEGPPRPLSEVAPDAPAELVAICERAMAREPQARYEDMGALAEDLSAYLEGRVVSAYATGALAEARKWVLRNRALAASLAAALLLLVLGLVVSLSLGREARANFDLAEERRQDAVKNMERALKSEAEATGRAEEVLRLAALQDIEVLYAEAAELWPPHPDQIAAYKGWIAEARALVEVLDVHRAKRDELRATAIAVGGPTDAPAWIFPDTEGGRQARWWHANMERLISSIESLLDEETGLLSQGDSAVSIEHGWSIPRRLRFAERLQRGSTEGATWAARWATATAAVREHPDYGGLELTPQVGLVPLGPDPRSGLWEFWHVATGKEPLRDEDGDLALEESTGVVLVLLPGGRSWMGASPDPGAPHHPDPGAATDEGPVHQVELSPFFLSKYELTQGQWARLTGTNPALRSPESRDYVKSLLHPVEQVSWDACDRVLARVGLDLPSEAQWEYGCRAGTESPWPFPLSDFSTHANVRDDTYRRWFDDPGRVEPWSDGTPAHGPVGHLEANAFGLHDVIGNVWEWCSDAYEPDAYARTTDTHPAPVSESPRERVFRGGSFIRTADFARTANRSYDVPDREGYDLGVRAARPIWK